MDRLCEKGVGIIQPKFKSESIQNEQESIYNGAIISFDISKTYERLKKNVEKYANDTKKKAEHARKLANFCSKHPQFCEKIPI